MLLSGGEFSVWTAVAVVVLVGMLFQLFRPLPEYKDKGGAPQAEAELGVAYGSCRNRTAGASCARRSVRSD